jgi:hypothetical protein
VQALKKAYELTILAILLHELALSGGMLTFKWQVTPLGSEPHRELPATLRAAAFCLARETTDQAGNDLSGARQLLWARVDQKRNSTPPANDKREQSKAFIQNLAGELDQDWGRIIPDWKKAAVQQSLLSYIYNDVELRNAYIELHRPDDAALKRLWRNKGDQRPLGGTFDESGYYCPKCGGLIGKDQIEAARNGWQCFVDPSHDTGLRPPFQRQGLVP